jgi:hypothetical protein
LPETFQGGRRFESVRGLEIPVNRLLLLPAQTRRRRSLWRGSARTRFAGIPPTPGLVLGTKGNREGTRAFASAETTSVSRLDPRALGPGLHSLRLRFNVSMSQPGAQPGSGSSIAPAGPLSSNVSTGERRGRLGQSGRSDVAARKGQAPILSPAPESGLWVVWAARGQELRGFERMRGSPFGWSVLPRMG